MDGWDIAIMAAAGFVAVTSLVRLMIARRNELTAEMRSHRLAERRKKGDSKAAGRSRDKAA